MARAKRIILAALSVLMMSAAPAAAQNLIDNGDFHAWSHGNYFHGTTNGFTTSDGWYIGPQVGGSAQVWRIAHDLNPDPHSPSFLVVQWLSGYDFSYRDHNDPTGGVTWLERPASLSARQLAGYTVRYKFSIWAPTAPTVIQPIVFPSWADGRYVILTCPPHEVTSAAWVYVDCVVTIPADADSDGAVGLGIDFPAYTTPLVVLDAFSLEVVR